MGALLHARILGGIGKSPAWAYPTALYFGSVRYTPGDISPVALYHVCTKVQWHGGGGGLFSAWLGCGCYFFPFGSGGHFSFGDESGLPPPPPNGKIEATYPAKLRKSRSRQPAPQKGGACQRAGATKKGLQLFCSPGFAGLHNPGTGHFSPVPVSAAAALSSWPRSTVTARQPMDSKLDQNSSRSTISQPCRGLATRYWSP